MSHTPVLNHAIGNYLTGYADGEGSFCVSFSPRSKLKTKLEVRPSFSVSQNSNRKEVLEKFLEVFGCGTIRPNPSDKTFKYEVRSIKDLIKTVIPHFLEYPLMSSKKKDFAFFKEICEIINKGGHLENTKLKKIVELGCQMNTSGVRRYKREQLLNMIR